MRPTFLAFQTASRAMAASKTNIDVTGNNIANVNTVGYTRQRVDQAAISGSGYRQKYTMKDVSEGLGVEVLDIGQIRDPFLDARFRNQNAETGRFDTIVKGLNDLENNFDEIGDDKLHEEISSFITQLRAFANKATNPDLAFVAKTAAQKVTQIINIYANQTQEVRDQNIKDLTDVVITNSFNSKVKSIANLNQQIREEQLHGNTPNELLDERNKLIDELSNIASIKVSTSPEKISEDLSIENISISLFDKTRRVSIDLIQNGLYNTLSVDKSSEQLKIEINTSFGTPPDGDRNITKYMTSGTIKGYLDIINGKGDYADTAAGENEFRGTLYYTKVMDTFAQNFAYALNELNGLGDANAKMLFTGSDPAHPEIITAANIRISSAWLADATYITTTSVPPNPAEPPSGTGDNINRMIAMLEHDYTFVADPYGAGPHATMFTGTYNEYMRGTIGTLSLDVELNQNFADTSANVSNNLDISREAIMGVSLDDEGINLMAYQKSYNAAARYFTVLDEAVDTLINNMGIVGR